MNQELFEKNLVKKLAKQPDVIRFMRKVVLEMGYDVSKFSKLTTKYYASLQAFELDVIKNLGMSNEEVLRMLENGKVDSVTETKLVEFLRKNSIEIPKDLLVFDGLSTLLVQLGQHEYNLSDRNRRLKGLESNAQMLIGGGVSDSVANAVKERRQYILDYRDEQNFLRIGQAVKSFVQARQEGKEERKDNRTERRIQKINAKQSAKTERTQLRADSRTETGGVFGQVGGVLGNIFGGGGAIPQYEDPNLYNYGSADLARNITETTKDSSENNTVLYVGLGLGAVVLLKVLKVF